MKKYPEYKDSGIEWIGKIPNHWHLERTKWLFSESKTRNRNQLYSEIDLLSVSEYYGVDKRIEHIEEDDILNRANSLDEYKVASIGDLVINIMLAWKKGLGVSSYNGIVSPSYNVFNLRIKGNPKYFHYLYRTNKYAEHFRQHSKGIIDSRLRMYPEEFGKTTTILPPEDEQTTIANFLDHKTQQIDDLIAKKERLIELLKEERTAVINQAVTNGLDPNVQMKDSGIEWLGEVPEHWDLKKIKWIADVYGGSTPSSSTEEFWNGDINWVTTDDLGSLNDRFIITTQRKITEAGLNNIGKSLAPIGSLVISNRAPIGHIGLLKVDAATNQGCKSIIFKRNINSEFYYYCLLNSKEQLDSLGRGTTFKELSTQSLKDFITVFPPYFEQTVIANFLNLKTQQIDDQIKLIQQEISLIQEYKTSLINETVTGKIDVRDYQINHVTV